MKVYVINQKVFIARHWFRWYRVQRSGEDWHALKIGNKHPGGAKPPKKATKPKEFDIAKTAEKLKADGR